MSEPFIATDHLRVAFKRGRRSVDALAGVSVSIQRGEAVGLVGESGSGKTTLARVLLGLQKPASGAATIEGRSIADWLQKDRSAFRRRIQMIFQDPYGSLNPRLTIGSALAEPLRVHRLVSRGAESAAVSKLMEMVELDPALATRYPHEFSGGQRQRIGIARALATQPEILIADEPVSALDVSVQAQVLNLLKRLQRENNLTLLLIAHDLAAVRYVCDRVVVLYHGEVVEQGPVTEVLKSPCCPYTQTLLASVPEVL